MEGMFFSEKSISLPPPPAFSSFTLQGYTPEVPPSTVVESPTIGFKTAPSSPFSEPQSPASPPVQWYTPPTTPQNDLKVPPAQHHASVQPSSESVPPSAPLLVPQPGLKAPGEHAASGERSEGVDDAYPSIIDLAYDSGFDEEGLNTLEKIYLYSRSDSHIHRTFIAHALPTYLEQVSPQEAVEYVLPLIHNLAVDEEESVKAALATELVPVIWWFFSHCQLISDDLEGLESYASTSTMVTISVQAFTPILGTLLLGTSEKIITPARFAVLDLLARMRRADDREAGVVRSPSSADIQLNLAFLSNNLVEEDEETPASVGLFKSEERAMFRQELLHSVIIGMSRLDLDMEYESTAVDNPEDWNYALHREDTSMPAEKPSTNTSPSRPDNPYFPPVSNSQSPSSTPPVSPPLAEQKALRNNSRKSISPRSPPAHSPTTSTHSPNTRSPKSTSPSSGKYSPPPSPGNEWPQENPRVPNRMEQDHHEEYDEAYEYSGSDARKAALGRLSSMSLMAAVTATGSLEEEYQRAFVKEIERVGRDAAYFYVRREASLALGALAKVVPQELVSFSLLPLFDALRWDQDFRVRQSALFALPAILPRLSPNQRRTVALETTMALSKDRYGAVRIAVLETLGEVLHTFQNDPGGPPKELLDLFLGRPEDKNVREGLHWSCYIDGQPQPAEQALEFFYTDPERPLICAFNFPAVALTLGPARWAELREYYFELSQHKSVQTRRTMAASLGEIARIIGQNAATTDLLPLWWDALQHDDESVRTKALETLDLFLPVLGRPGKTLIEGLLTSWEEGKFRGWRERETVIGALETYVTLLGQDTVGDLVRRLILKGLEDTVAAVREKVRSVLPQLWEMLSPDPGLRVGLQADLDSLASASIFRRRMTFIACTQTRVQHMGEKQLSSEIGGILKSIAQLANDPVVDVRIAVARFLAFLYSTYGTRATSAEDFRSSVDALSSDPSHDVKSFLFELQTNSSSPVRGTVGQRSIAPPNPRHSKSELFSRPPASPLPSPTREIDSLTRVKKAS